MKKTIIPLEEWNELNSNRFKIDSYPKKNGLECPNCKLELMDRDEMILCSNPPQRNIVCDCGYTGYRIA